MRVCLTSQTLTLTHLFHQRDPLQFFRCCLRLGLLNTHKCARITFLRFSQIAWTSINFITRGTLLLVDVKAMFNKFIILILYTFCMWTSVWPPREQIPPNCVQWCSFCLILFLPNTVHICVLKLQSVKWVWPRLSITYIFNDICRVGLPLFPHKP